MLSLMWPTPSLFSMIFHIGGGIANMIFAILYDIMMYIYISYDYSNMYEFHAKYND